ncbi:UDP-N-acetylenolpyruvoylglucosamine reductase [Fibrobacter sp.]|uniref:UDP-N-acetylenolpyruvoylglucosamine reductase n=1 Tax=Fibrobacter sp. TaxID=35828 RepID=UPI0038910E6C
MTTLQMDAIKRIETLSDDKVFYVIQILDGLEGLLRDAKEKQNARDQAFDTLEKIIKAAPELDYEKELASWRDERFAG